MSRETWVHGAAVAFDPGSSDRTRNLGNQIDLDTNGAAIRVGDRYPSERTVHYVFPWVPTAERDERASLAALDEVLVRLRSAGDVGIVKVDAYASETRLMAVRLDEPVVGARDEFAVFRFQATRPQGWGDLDTPIRGPLAVGLTVEGSNGGAGSVDISAVGVRLRAAYLGPFG